MSSALPKRSVREQIRQAVDPEEKMLPILTAVGQHPELPSWMAAVNSELDTQWRALAAHGEAMEALMEKIEEALTELVPRGWAVFNMQSEEVERAVKLVKADRGGEADELLADQWESSTYRTKRVCDRVSSMGSAEAAYRSMFVERARLLRQARSQHERGEYAASIQMVHSQIEGIATDVTANKKFFSTSKTRQADVVDPMQLVSIEASLAALRLPYVEGVEQTQTQGSISRHGVAHGRELAYDTRTVSAKAWSLLDAIVEWALPLARQEADRRRVERQQTATGSTEVDEHGRRIDDREFHATRDVLRLLVNSSIGWWSRRSAFRDDLIGAVYSENHFSKRGLPADHGLEMRVSPDGQCVWLWRPTISGWVLGIAVAAEDGNFREWLYAGAGGPTLSPLDDEGTWGEVFETPRDWTD